MVFKFYSGVLVFPQLRKHFSESPHLLLLLRLRVRKGDNFIFLHYSEFWNI